MYAIRAQAPTRVERVQRLVEWPAQPSTDWCKGFLAGIFDGEGAWSRGIVSIASSDPMIVDNVFLALRRLGFEGVFEPGSVRIRGGVREHLRFFQTVDPAITRKRDVAAQALKSRPCRVVEAVDPLGVTLPMFDVTTSTGDFIADGVVSHNCYARPSHEYLGFGAGTDFDTRIVVKPRAPELLREAFDARSWKGDTIVFSGVTDCYQPFEASYRLTRGCLEVCAEYKNPCGIITKAPLIERDLDVLERLNRDARVSVTVSIPFWDETRARAIEPYVATPRRRVKTIERLAERGIPVGVNVAPIIPGLSDEDIAPILAAAREAGARWAGMTLLRLPGSVAAVFVKRVKDAMPLRADKILARIRETRGGKLYDPRWRTRQVGEGEYAQTIQSFFAMTKRRLGYPEAADEPADSTTTFSRPNSSRRGQLPLL
jgi:DNA repair photolyase